MEPNKRAHIASSKFAQEDFISNMPEIVVTNILDRLPIQDAVKTSSLSKNWRFKWTTLSQLVFDEDFFEYVYYNEKHYDEKYYLRIVSRLLLSIKDAITKFHLYIYEDFYEEDFAHWISFLSKKGLTDLTIRKLNGMHLGLPTHLFSCLELKHLMLQTCDFDPPTSFHGFPNLLSLVLNDVVFDKGKFGEFFTQCPVLEILYHDSGDYAEVKLDEIAKLTNLKSLSLSLNTLDRTEIISSSSIFELLGFHPKLQELNLVFRDFKLTEDGPKKRCPTTFPCLKKLTLLCEDLGNGILLSFAFEMIRSFPNLQTLNIESQEWDVDPHLEFDYNTMEVLQLRSVNFTYCKGSEKEVCLIEYLLACSPFLKKFEICPYSVLESDEKLKFARKLLVLHRASPVAEIKLD